MRPLPAQRKDLQASQEVQNEMDVVGRSAYAEAEGPVA